MHDTYTYTYMYRTPKAKPRHGENKIHIYKIHKERKT